MALGIEPGLHISCRVHGRCVGRWRYGVLKQKPGEAAMHVPKPDLMAFADQVSEGPVQKAHLNMGALRSGRREKKQRNWFESSPGAWFRAQGL